MRRFAIRLALLLAAAALAAGCSASADRAAPGGGGGSGGGSTIAISNGGTITPENYPDPAPIGTTFTFDGWTAKLLSAELTTQANSDPSNPRAAVLQVRLALDAPQKSEGQYTRNPPFTAAGRVNGSDMATCRSTSDYDPIAPGDSGEVTWCLSYRGSEKAVTANPSAHIKIRYSDYKQVASIQIQTTRGKDY